MVVAADHIVNLTAGHTAGPVNLITNPVIHGAGPTVARIADRILNPLIVDHGHTVGLDQDLGENPDTIIGAHLHTVDHIHDIAVDR